MACDTYGGEESFLQGFSGENWEKRPLDKPRHRREDDVIMDLNEIGWGS